MVKPQFAKSLMSWKPISNPLLSARFAHKDGHLSVIVAYAPTEPSEHDTKELFYNQLSSVTQPIPPHDTVVILGDFNAVSGTSDNGCKVVGPFGSGVPNDNSDCLISYCGMHGLTIVGSWFQRLDIHRQTCMSHDSSIRKEIDHILTHSRDKTLFKSCRLYWGAEAPANTDQVLLVSELCVEPYRPKKQQVQFRPFDTTRLTQDPIRQRQYNIAVKNKFGPLSSCPDDDVDTSWNSFCTAIKSAATETASAPRRLPINPGCRLGHLLSLISRLRRRGTITKQNRSGYSLLSELKPKQPRNPS